VKDELKTTIVQTNIDWENRQPNIEMLNKKIETIQLNSTNIIVLPEMFTSGFTMNAQSCAETLEGETVQWMKKVAHEKNACVCGSLIINKNGKYFNCLVWMQPDGNFKTYDKHHLFRLANEQNTYQPGINKLIVECNGWRICPMICYDLRFPVWCRQTSFTEHDYRGEYDVLLFVANWPERRNTAWKALLQARSIENQCYVIGVNRVGDDGNKIYHSGDSSIFNALGETLFQMPHQEIVHTQTLSADDLIKTRRTYQFWKDADNFLVK
jgi:predicted amidohydrolase